MEMNGEGISACSGDGLASQTSPFPRCCAIEERVWERDERERWSGDCLDYFEVATDIIGDSLRPCARIAIREREVPQSAFTGVAMDVVLIVLTGIVLLVATICAWFGLSVRPTEEEWASPLPATQTQVSDTCCVFVHGA